MGKMSREKGKRGEREVAAILRDHGYEGRRGQQFCGDNGDADVVGLPGYHLEVKRTERLDLDRFYDQSQNDALEGEIPTVVHRKNGKPWFITMRLDDFLDAINKPPSVL